MMKFLLSRKHGFLAMTVLLSAFKLSAQTAVPVRRTVEKAATVNFTELGKYYQAHPSPLVRKPMFDEDGERGSHPVHLQTDPSKIKRMKRSSRLASPSSYTAELPASPAPIDSFLSSTSSLTTIPPDTHGAVDTAYCVSTVNDSIVIRSRTGAFVTGLGLDDFWSTVESFGPGAYDPRVHYDPNYKRWIMVADCYGKSVNSTILVAVSATGDPTGSWHLYKLPVGTSSGVWLDFPLVGFNNKWVAVSGNFFDASNSFTNDVIYVFDYSNMMSGTAVSYSTLLPPGGSFCVAPALTYDADESNLYAIEDYNGSAGQLQLWQISGPVGSPNLVAWANPTSAITWHREGGSGSDFAPQAGTTHKVQTNDSRINNLSERNGNLWCAHTVFLPASGTATRCSAMWWEIDTSGTPLQNGMINDPAGRIFYAFPSIAVNMDNDALMGFAYFSASTYPSAAYSLHMAADPADAMRPLNIYRHGQKPYYQTFGGSNNRWGDYSATCIDPKNDKDFWTLQESVPNYSGTDISGSTWDTWWGYVQLCAAPDASFSIAGHTTPANTGDLFTYTGTSVPSGTYTWNYSGGTATPGGTGGGPQTVKWTTTGLKTVTLSVTNATGCVSNVYSDTVLVTANVAVEQINAPDFKISTSPNPSDGNFDILFNKNIEQKVEVKIIDISGRSVYHNEYPGTSDNMVRITTKGLPSGTYTITVAVEDVITSKKITINR